MKKKAGNTEMIYQTIIALKKHTIFHNQISYYQMFKTSFPLNITSSGKWEKKHNYEDSNSCSEEAVSC